jgi:hypothetical protein
VPAHKHEVPCSASQSLQIVVASSLVVMRGCQPSCLAIEQYRIQSFPVTRLECQQCWQLRVNGWGSFFRFWLWSQLLGLDGGSKFNPQRSHIPDGKSSMCGYKSIHWVIDCGTVCVASRSNRNGHSRSSSSHSIIQHGVG